MTTTNFLPGHTLYVISGIGGMTGFELTKQIIASNTNYHIIGFDNLFNCDAKKISNLCSHNRNIILQLGLEWSIENIHCMQSIYNDVFNMIKNYQDIINVVYVNCAAVVHTKHFYHPSDTFDVNVEGMRMFLEQILALTTLVKERNINFEFINCSTSEVYSAQSWKPGGVKENDILSIYTVEHSMRTSYAIGKLMTEMFAKEAFENHKLKTCSVRFANVYTEDELQPEHIIPYIINEFNRGNEVHLLENAKETQRTFLHNHDSASAVLTLIANPSALDGSVYNVGTTEEVFIKDLALRIGKLMNIENPRILFDRPARKADPKRRMLNVDKLESLGWKPQVTLNDGLRRCCHVMS